MLYIELISLNLISIYQIPCFNFSCSCEVKLIAVSQKQCWDSLYEVYGSDSDDDNATMDCDMLLLIFTGKQSVFNEKSSV